MSRVLNTELEGTILQVNETKKIIISVCNELKKDNSNFNPEIVKHMVETYLEKEDKLPRLLYSDMTSYFLEYYRENKNTGVIELNADALINYVYKTTSTNNEKDEIRKTIARIYDHCLLAINQINAIKNFYKENINNAKDEIKDDITRDIQGGIQREYVTILGIFAAIVLGFTGSFALSSSVLQYFVNASAYRIAYIFLFLMLFFTNMISVLVNFIRDINHCETRYPRYMCWFNWAVFVALIASLCAEKFF